MLEWAFCNAFNLAQTGVSYILKVLEIQTNEDMPNWDSPSAVVC